MTIIQMPKNEFKGYSDDVLNHLKEVELIILKDFIEICEKNQLNYFIFAGSALGAVRHQGFIPWDDEIDVAMLRKDYEKFLEVFDRYDKYDLISWNSKLKVEKKAYSPKTQMSLKNTKTFHIINNVGIYLDISALDNFPENTFNIFLFICHLKIIYFSYYLLNIIISDMYISSSKESLGHFIRFILKIFHLNSDFFACRFTKLIKKYNNKNCSYICDISYYYDKPIPKKIFMKNRKVKFESLEVNIPENYDVMLKILYGDYMKLPPKEEQINHGWNLVDFGDY